MVPELAMSRIRSWDEALQSDTLAWLLAEDFDNPGPRLHALTDLNDLLTSNPEVVAARQNVMVHGPVPVVLKTQEPEGYWVKPGPGYNPKYRSTVWSVISLSQLGADGEDPGVRLAGNYLLDHAIAKNDAFSVTGTPSGAIHCLNGNLTAALIDLGWLGDPRMEGVIDWMACAITGEGMAPREAKDAPRRYLASGTPGPGFRCSANDKLPCAWGAIKAMQALSRIPENKRSALVDQAIQVGIDFFFSCDPAGAYYPMGYSEKPSRNWWKFGYPIFYISDMLQILEVLCALGYGGDRRLDAAYQILLDKQDKDGRWHMEYTYNGKTWVDVEDKKKPSKWVTLRAMRVLKQRQEASQV